MNSIFHRVSIRKYTDQKIEEEKIMQMLRAAMAAPSACNQQPWEYYVVTDKKKILELSETSPYAKCAAGAPLVFVPCYRMEGIAPDYFEIDLSASVENLLLEADELGLGAVWTAAYPYEDRIDVVRQNTGLPENIVPLCVIPIGYPDGPQKAKDKFDSKRVHRNIY